MPVNRSVAVRLGVNVDMDQARRDLEGITSQVNRLGATRTDAARAQFEQLGTTVGRTATAYKGLTDEQRRAYEQREADAQQVTRLRRAFSTLEGALAALDTQVQHGHRSAEEAARLQEGLVAAYTNTSRAARDVAAANSNLLGSMTGLQRGWVDMHAAIARNKADLGELVSAIKAVGAAQRDAASPMQQKIAATVGISDGPSVANDVRQRDLEAWSREIDAVRARLVPGEQAVQRYQAALLDLAEAQRTGAVAGADFEAAQAHIEATLNPAVLAARKEEQALRGLIDDLDESAAASKHLAEQQALLDKALAGQIQGVTLSRAEHERLSSKLRETAGANDNTTRSTKLAAHEMVNLSYQIQDLGVQLVSGQSPFMALAQQGPQAVMAVGGLNRALALLLSPVGLVVIGVGAVVGAAGALIGLREGYASSVREMTRANELMGASLGVTSSQLEAMADRAADAGEISTRSARSMIAEYTALGKTAPDVVERLTAVTRDFSRATSQDLDAAGKELSGYFRDPARGAEELAAKYNMLSGATLDYIRRLTESGQKTEAQRVLVDALGQRVKAAADETSIWARAWDAVGRNASNAADSIGRVIDRAVNGPTLEQKVEAARKAMLDARQAAKPRTGGIIANQHAYDEQLDEAQADAAAAEKRYNDLMEEVRERNRAAAVRGVAANNNAASRDALAVTERYDALGQSLRKAQGELATLQRGLGPNMGQAAGAGQRAVEALQNQISDLTKVQASGLDLQAYKTKELAALETRYAGQLGPAAAARKAEEAARINLLGTATTTTERSAQADAARSQVIAGQTQALAQQSAALTVNARGSLAVADAYEKSAAAGAAAEARRQAMTEAISSGVDVETRAAQLLQERAAQQAATSAQGLRQQQDDVAGRERVAEATLRGAAAQHEAELAEKVRAGTLAEVTALENASGETADKLRGIIERKTKAILADDAAQRRSTIALAIRQQKDQLELGQRQLELIGASAEARAVEIARLQALITLRNQNIDVASAEGQQYLRNAETMARQGLELERVTAAYQELGQFGDRTFDAIINATAQAKDATLGWRNALSTVGAELKTLVIRMGALNPAKNLLLGTNLPTVADLPIFGGSSTAAANQAGGASGLASNALSLGSKFMPSSWTGGIGNSIATGINQVGYSMGIGGTAFTSGALSGSITGMGAAGMGSAAGGAASAAGVAAVPGGLTNAAVSGAGSGLAPAMAGGASLMAYLGPAAAGLAAGGLIGPLVANGNKAVGGLAGAASGAAAGALIGSVIPGIGTLVGALVGGAGGGLGGLLGTQKPSVGKTASADVTIGASGLASYGNILTDNEGDAAAGQALGQAVSAIFNAAKAGGGTLSKSFGFGQTETDGYFIGGSVDYKKFGDNFADMMRYALIDQGGLQGGGANTLAAVKNSRNQDAAEFSKDVALGAAIDAGITALAEFDKSLTGVTNAAKKAADANYANAIAEKQRADGLGIGSAYADLVTRQILESFDPVTLTPLKSALATLDGQFAALTDAVHTMGLSISDAEIAAAKAAQAEKLLKSYRDEYDAALRSAQGLSSVDQAMAIRGRWSTNWQDDLAAGRNPTDLYGEQMKALFAGISDLTVLNQAAAALQNLDSVAAGFAQKRADDVRAAVQEDLTLRKMQAQVQLGQVSQDAYDQAALEIAQKRELAAVTDTAVRAQLEQVHATERAAAAAKTAAEAQQAFASASGSTRSYLLSLMTGEAGGLSAPDRYRNAQNEYATASAAIGPQATAEQLARQTEAAKALLAASRAMNGSTTEYFRDLANVSTDLATSAQITPDDPVVTAINALKASVDGLGGKVDVQVSVDAINFVRGEIEQTITTHVSTAGLSDREIQLANGLLSDVRQSVTVALSPVTGLTAREMQLYQGALSNLDQSITAAVDTSALTGANREIALGQLSDATRTINTALGVFPTMTAEQREFVLGASRDFARTVNGTLGTMPNLSAEQQAILLGQTDSFGRTFNALAGTAPSLSAEQSEILAGVSDGFTRTFSAAVSAMPVLSQEQRAVLLGQTDSFSRIFNAVAGAVPQLSAEQAAILSGTSDSFTRAFNSAVGALPALSAEQRAVLLGQNGAFTTTFQGIVAGLPGMSTEQRAILLGQSDGFSRTFSGLVGVLPGMSQEQRSILLGVSDSFTRVYQQAVAVLPGMSAEQRAILTGYTDSFTRTFQSAAAAMPSMSADQLAILRGQTDDFTRTFVAATNDLTLTADEKAVLQAKSEQISRTITQAVETTETVDISRSIDDKLSSILAEIKAQMVAANTNLGTVNKSVVALASPNNPITVTSLFKGGAGMSFETGGVIPGGVVGNGIWGKDSVMARYAGGGTVNLAGGEGILTAPATSAIGGPDMVEFINRTRSLPVAAMRPVVMPVVGSPRHAASSGDGLVTEVKRLREEVAALRRDNNKLIQQQALMDEDGRQKQTAALLTANKTKHAASAA